MKSTLLHSLLAVLLSISSSVFAKNVSIYPIEQQGSVENPVTYFINNEESSQMSVEVITEQLSLSEEGIEVVVPTKDLKVDPIQFLLKGKSLQYLKVQLKEGHLLEDKEQAYRITIRFFPLALKVDDDRPKPKQEFTSLKIYYYVAPKKQSLDVGISDAFIHGNILSIHMFNRGNVHTRLKNPQIVLRSKDGFKMQIDDPQILKGLSDEQIFSNSSRQFYISLPDTYSKPLERIELKVQGGNLNNKTFSFEPTNN